MRKFFWGGMALLVVGAATVYWTANYAVKHPNSPAARWAVSVAQMGFPGSALHNQRHPRTVTVPAPAVEQEQCEEPHHCFAQVEAQEAPAADLPATEPVEVIQVQPWHPDTDVPLSNRADDSTTVQTNKETPASEGGDVVVTIPDNAGVNPFDTEEAEAQVPVMPLAEENEELSRQTAAVGLVCAWLWNVFGNGCTTTGPDAADGVEESEQPEAESDATMPQDQGCPDYHRNYCPRGCPYSGGCPYHYSPRPAYQPPVTPVQEEESTEPTPQPEPEKQQTGRTSRYTPYIDTMEFRPSDGPGYRVDDTAF